MTKIEKLEEELYAPEDVIVEQRMKRRLFFPRTLKKPLTFWRRERSANPESGEGRVAYMARRILIGASVALFLGGVLALLFYYISLGRHEVSLKIQAREGVESGESVTVSFSDRKSVV